LEQNYGNVTLLNKLTQPFQVHNQLVHKTNVTGTPVYNYVNTG